MKFYTYVHIMTRWILANAIGWAVGLALGVLLVRVVSEIPWINPDRFFGVAMLISLGPCVGVAQWVVMRRYLPRPFRWVAATSIGFLLCLVIGAGSNLLRLGRNGILDDALLFALMGTAIGFSHWCVLRKHYPKAGWWILATAVGFLCFVVFVVNPASKVGESIVRGAILGGFAAIAPGAVLTWLVRKPSTSITEPIQPIGRDNVHS